VQSTKCQRGHGGHLEDDPFWNAKPVEADQDDQDSDDGDDVQ